MNTKEIELSSELISLWEINDIAKYSELESELLHSNELDSFLGSYLKERWIVEHIQNIEITEHPNQLHISYVISLYNGCRNLDEKDDTEMTLDYEIDLHSNQIKITGQSIPEERSTFEEF